MLPTDSLDTKSKWKCEKCCHSIEAEKVSQIVEELLQERNSIPKADVPGHLQFVSKAEKLLHPNHYVLTCTKRWILPLLCQNPKGASEQEWKGKLKMAMDYLTLIETMNLGLIKDKGRTLFEVSNSILALAKIQRENGQIGEEQFKGCLINDLFPILTEIIHILRFDGLSSFEGKLCEASKFYLKSFQNYSRHYY